MFCHVHLYWFRVLGPVVLMLVAGIFYDWFVLARCHGFRLWVALNVDRP